MKSHHISKEEPNNVAFIIDFVAWYEMCHFIKTINRHRNGITTTLSFQKTDDKIHANIFPIGWGNKQMGVKSMRYYPR